MKIDIDLVFLRLLLIVGLIFTAATTLCIEILENVSRVKYCMPSNIKPIHYNITLTTFIKSNLFNGESFVSVYINRATQNISLHSANLNIYEALLINNNINICYISTKYTNINETHITVLHFVHDILPGFYTLNLKFRGSLANNAGIIFFSTDQLSSINKQETQMWFIATHFSKIGARTVFPCWDLLESTATFKITIRHPEDYTVLSNMPKLQSDKDEYGLSTSFSKTPSMPTYLVMIVLVPNKDFIHTIPLPSENITILSRNHLSKHMTYTCNLVRDVMFYLKHKWMHYSVPKIDFVAVPTMNINSYSYDHISSLGLALHKEDDIIYDENLHHIAQKARMMYAVSREAVYQWVGHLLNLPHLTHSWLQIGFVTFFGAYAIDKVVPKSRMMDLFVVHIQQEALRLDNKHIINPLIFQNNNPSEINSHVSFAYHLKASIVFRMLQNLLPYNVFRNGIAEYIDKIHHGFGLATPDDFWTAMQFSLNKSSISPKFMIKEMIDILITQSSYPVINVKRDGFNSTRISIENLADITSHKMRQLNWTILITITTQENPTFSTLLDNITHYWLTPMHQVHTDFKVHTNHWFIVNVQQTGYYRVNYDDQNWHQIARYLNSNEYSKIHVLNRAQIIDDAFHFMIARKLKSSLFWEITKYLSQETDYVAWYPMFKALEYMSTMLHYEKATVIKEMSTIWNALLKIIGYDESNDDDLKKCLRLEVTKWACILENHECLNKANYTLAIYSTNTAKKLSFEWNDWVYCKGMILANRNTWNIVKRLGGIFDPKIASYLSCSKNSNIIIEYWNDLITQHKTAQYKNHEIFLYVLARHVHHEALLTYILQHFETVKHRNISTIVLTSVIINHVYSYKRIEKIRQFVEKEYKFEEQELTNIRSKIELRMSQIDKQIKNADILKK